MIGIKHLGIAIAFGFSMILIDLDHRGLSINQLWRGFIGLPVVASSTSKVLHNPLLFYIVLAFTLGVGLHLLMDKVKR